MTYKFHTKSNKSLRRHISEQLILNKDEMLNSSTFLLYENRFCKKFKTVFAKNLKPGFHKSGNWL